MFNLHLRKLCLSTVRSSKSISAFESLQKIPKEGCGGWHMMETVRHFRNQPIIIPKPKKVYHPAYEYQETVEDTSVEDERTTKEIICKVNNQISSKSHGRLFAVIYVNDKQVKVTQNDLIVVEGDWPPEPNDALRFEKILLVGSNDFTLLGRPLLMPDLVRVTGLVIDKVLEPTRYYFRYRPREQKKTSYFNRAHMTMVRIKSIELTSLLDENKEVEGVKGRVF